MNILITVKKLFLYKLSLREKGLFLLLISAIILSWAFRVNEQIRLSYAKHNQVRQTLKSQQLWIQNEPKIDQDLKERLTIFDRKKTYSSIQLVSKIDELARSEKLEPTLYTPISKEATNFNINTLRVNFRSIPLSSIIQFQDKLEKEAPYITLKNLKINANKQDPNLLNADFEILSFELIQDIFL